ncbi:hypothetical protein COT95_00560 [Candidatus Falkowbacteria bacterium CG10_big_fil_rev_8_21_14_0_10_37_6]|uniref:AtpZ/AtpI family protein n=1 Tax=Candidatus Falkowbacteria bacterium CG10_big_fil_rev_8_21_14_0_10_37_6 TaxID=1974563 RepID=A0A2H0V7L4_9BACT|nr:MAG: hypothetical protein COT95_00560 [Candidatus Falkowbacteria bacterium CG10_big_fil_rev_8_21_14_0_10_37_6]
MKNKNNIKELMVSSALYVSSSIFGPLLIFGGAGYLVDNIFKTNPWGILAGVFAAFIFTNILLFKKIARLSKNIETYAQQPEKQGDKNKS